MDKTKMIWIILAGHLNPGKIQAKKAVLFENYYLEVENL